MSSVPETNPQYILVIDDDEAARHMLFTYLRHRNYRVEMAGSGTEALEMIEKEPPDLVILDVLMPEMSGLTVLQKLRERHQPVEMPVILLTALGDTRDMVRGLELGASDYLTKPIEIAVLAARLRIHLRTKRLHAQTVVGMERLQELDEMKDRFLQIAAHDLKSPLGTMSMGLQILADAAPAACTALPEYERVLNMMGYAMNVMQSIIDDYLDLQTIKSGKLQLDVQPIQLNTQVQAVIDQFSAYAESKDITLNTDLDPALPRCPGDPDRLIQVINNLVGNAIKFTPRGGLVTARTTSNGGSLRLEVTDNGPGIPEEEIPKLFREFTRLSNRPTGGEKSSGVGLAISRYLVEAHRGTIGVSSTVGKGTTFWVELPSQQANHGSPAAA